MYTDNVGEHKTVSPELTLTLAPTLTQVELSIPRFTDCIVSRICRLGLEFRNETSLTFVSKPNFRLLSTGEVGELMMSQSVSQSVRALPFIIIH